MLVVLNIFEPCALNLKFQHFIPYFLKIHYFTTMNLQLEKELRDERKAHARSVYQKL